MTAKKKDQSNTTRMEQDSTFHFGCNKGAGCFTQCCGDVLIFLSPYDIIRMKNALGIPSYEFLEKYTLLPIYKELRLPVRILKMKEDDDKKCPFVTDDGCSIYENRPWPCRMYPITEESEQNDYGVISDYYALLKEDRCKGHDSEDCKAYTLGEWLDEQGLKEYSEMDKLFREVTTHEFFDAGGMLNEQKMHMFHTAAYDVDRFRIFVFETKFLQVYDIPEDRLEKMKTDDVELVKFAFEWLRFSLFGDEILKPREEAIKKFKEGSKALEEDERKFEDVAEHGWKKKNE